MLSTMSDRDTVQIGARFLKHTFAEGLGIFFDILTEPTFPDKEVNRERADQLRELDSLKEHRFNFAFHHFLQTFYGPHPYNRLALGLYDSLASVTREDLLAWHHTVLQPARMVFTVVGDIAAEEVLTLFARKAPSMLFDTRPGPALHTSAPPTQTQMYEQVITLDGQQTHIIWGFPTVNVQHRDRYALRLLDTILGGMGGRLFVELRDKKSLAYTVTTFDTYPVDGGFMALYIGCSPDKEGASDIGMQSTSQRTAIYGIGQLQLGRWNAFQEYLAAIQRTTAADVQRVAQTYLDASRSVRVILRAKA
jgi:zinc protease